MTTQKRIALVTGANRGIGLEVTRQLASRGLRVFLGARNVDDAEKCAAELRAHDLDVTALELDVTSDASVARAAAAAGAVHVLVNNAGIANADQQRGSWTAGVLSATSEDWRQVMETNFFGALRMVRAVVPGMISRGYGRVVNVSSGYGSFGEGLEGPAPYSTSKASLDALTLKLSQEVRGDVKVNAVCPGWVRTDMGGKEAERSVEDGAAGVVWAATLPEDGPSGVLFRDGKRVPW